MDTASVTTVQEPINSRPFPTKHKTSSSSSSKLCEGTTSLCTKCVGQGDTSSTNDKLLPPGSAGPKGEGVSHEVQTSALEQKGKKKKKKSNKAAVVGKLHEDGGKSDGGKDLGPLKKEAAADSVILSGGESSCVEALNKTGLSSTHGDINPTPGNINPIPGNISPIPGNINPTPGNINPTPGNINPTLESTDYSKVKLSDEKVCQNMTQTETPRGGIDKFQVKTEKPILKDEVSVARVLDPRDGMVVLGEEARGRGQDTSGLAVRDSLGVVQDTYTLTTSQLERSDQSTRVTKPTLTTPSPSPADIPTITPTNKTNGEDLTTPTDGLPDDTVSLQPSVKARKTARDKFKVCENCRLEILDRIRVCSACKRVAYCNNDCQKGHWKTHKLTCSYYLKKDVTG